MSAPLTWPAGAYVGATVDGKQQLLTRPWPVPLRYSMLSGKGAWGALKYRLQVPTPGSLLEGAACSRQKGK